MNIERILSTPTFNPKPSEIIAKEQQTFEDTAVQLDGERKREREQPGHEPKDNNERPHQEAAAHDRTHASKLLDIVA